MRAAAAAALAALAALGGCATAEVHEYRRIVMGAECRILVAADEASADRAAAIRKEFEAAGVTFHEADVPAYRKATASFYTSFPKWPAGLHEKVLAAAAGK